VTAATKAPTAPAPGSARRRVRARVGGTVQGVGFRPHVFRLSRELGLGGFVLNDSRGVVLEIEGAGEAVDLFLDRLVRGAPPLARVERVAAQEVAATGAGEFTIVASRPQAFQLDGDYLGERQKVHFVSVPEALRVIC